MADNVTYVVYVCTNITKQKNRESNLRSPQNYYLKIHIIFLTGLVKGVFFFTSFTEMFSVLPRRFPALGTETI